MKYETAKQLKDAGFPQGKPGIERRRSWFDGDGDLSDWWDGNECVYIPTLSELIEACRDALYSLSRTKAGMWGIDATYDKGKSSHATSCIYETPEEALANLYLALYGDNPKKKK